MAIGDYVNHLILSVFLIVGAYQFYFWCQRQQIRAARGMELAIDRMIPYRPGWVWIYSFLYYPIILYVNLIVESPRHFAEIAVSYLFLLFSQMAFFLLFPVETPESWRQLNRRRNLSERFLAFVQGFDQRSNCFPSMHCSVAMLTSMHLYPTLGPVAFTFTALIGISCLFTKQHYVADLPAGILLGWAIYEIFPFS